MKIFIDYDSTLNNFETVWVDWINMNYRTNINVSDILHWDWVSQQYGELANEFWKDPKIFENDIITPKQYSQEFLEQLRASYDVSILTNSWETTKEAKSKHIKRHYGNIKVIHASDKPSYTKNAILIDDNPKTINDHCIVNNMPGIVYDENFNYGWSKLNYKNVPKNIHPKLCIARDYNEIFSMLFQLYKEK